MTSHVIYHCECPITATCKLLNLHVQICVTEKVLIGQAEDELRKREGAAGRLIDENAE